jgi:hypothetical protein
LKRGNEIRLIELEPRWLSEQVFAFRCPHCKQIWLTCKNVVMGFGQQRDLAIAANLEPIGPRYGAVLTDEACAWKWESTDFATMSVTPSIDASKSGHWHGFITNGEIK